MSKPYIICVDLHDQATCVVGGGKVAARKVESLLEAGAIVQVIAPELCVDLQRLLAEPANYDRLTWQQGPYEGNLPAGLRLAIACTDDRTVNRRVRDDCRAAGVLCNVVDDPELCDFIVPAIRSIGPVQIAVSTSGTSPSLARNLADRLSRQVDPAIAELAERLSEIRLEVQAEIPDTGRRKELFGLLCGEESLRVLKESGEDGWRLWYRQQLARHRS